MECIRRSCGCAQREAFGSRERCLRDLPEARQLHGLEFWQALLIAASAVPNPNAEELTMTQKTNLVTALVAAVVAAVVSLGSLGIMLLYVTNNPEILVKMRAEINRYQQEEQVAQQQKAISDNADAIISFGQVSLCWQSERRRHGR